MQAAVAVVRCVLEGGLRFRSEWILLTGKLLQYKKRSHTQLVTQVDTTTTDETLNGFRLQPHFRNMLPPHVKKITASDLTPGNNGQRFRERVPYRSRCPPPPSSITRHRIQHQQAVRSITAAATRYSQLCTRVYISLRQCVECSSISCAIADASRHHIIPPCALPSMAGRRSRHPPQSRTP